MIEDARRIEPGATLECDICIVGAGPAGITVALELASTGARILLLEAGGTAFDAHAQALLDGEIVGDPHRRLRDTRLVALGGSTGVWAGWCRPLDPIDFESRAAVSTSGWPFGFETLVPHYQRAHELLGLGSFDYDPTAWERRLGTARLPVSHDDLETIVFQVSPIRFGDRYGDVLAASAHVRVLLHATALRFRMVAASERVEAVEVGTLGGPRFDVEAREIVLAAGGVANARLLLLSGDTPARAPGNAHGCVGRYYADHAFLNVGTFVADYPPPPMDFYFPATWNGDAASGAEAAGAPATVRGAFSLSRAVLEREGLLNAAVFFRPAYEAHPAFDTPEVHALLESWEKVRGRAVPGGEAALLLRAARRPDAVAIALWRRVAVRNGTGRWPLRASLDGEPRPENAVTLADDARDAFGRPLPRVRWSPGSLEIRSIRRAYEVLDGALRVAGLGRLDISLDDEGAWRAACESAKHHNMGTTRMHASPSEGVIDADAKVHGVANLHVAGSSVFPTFGYANPTLTIVALAVRLGRHLRARLSG